MSSASSSSWSVGWKSVGVQGTFYHLSPFPSRCFATVVIMLIGWDIIDLVLVLWSVLLLDSEQDTSSILLILHLYKCSLFLIVFYRSIGTLPMDLLRYHVYNCTSMVLTLAANVSYKIKKCRNRTIHVTRSSSYIMSINSIGIGR